MVPRDELEFQLTKMWEKVFDKKPIGVYDNFFELGGHSLLAVRLFAQLENLCGKKLPLATLFQATTIDQMAHLLRQEQWSPPWSSLVAIKPEGTKLPLYCVHGMDGNVLSFRALVSHLDPDQPFYGLQAKGLDGQEPPCTRIEQMATHYLQEIRAVQPEGPYCLGGYSFGGLVAFEMAQQLYAHGQHVALLGVFDTDLAEFRFGIDPRQNPQVGLLGVFDTHMLWIPLRYKLSFSFLVQRIAIHMRNLSLLSPQAKLTYIRQKVGKSMRHIASKTFPGLRPALSGVVQDVGEAGLLAVRAYVPQIYPGRVTVFRTSRRRLRFFQEAHLGWNKVALGGAKICQAGGDHGSMLEEPHVRALAAKLQACLDATQTYATR